MKKLLLLAAIGASALAGNAETKFYFADITKMGEARCVSPSGRYALFCDPDDEVAYLWDSENPTEFKQINDKSVNKFDAYGVNDLGEIVGSVPYLRGGTYQHVPCVYSNGEYTSLPLDINAYNSNLAIAISNDGKIIGGYQNTKAPGVEGYTACPTIWTKEEDGTFTVHTYNDIDLPNHQGLWVQCMHTDGTLEGTILGGVLNCGAGGQVPALLKDGKLVHWNKFESKDINFYYRGTLQGYYSEPFIDGYCDGKEGDYFAGGFLDCDAEGNFYGYRTQTVYPTVVEDGEILDYGEITRYASVYSLKNDSWSEKESKTIYITGHNNYYIFDTNGYLWVNGEKKDPQTHFNFSNTSGNPLAGFSRMDHAGKVIAGQYNVFNPATMNMDPFPALIVLDEPLSGVQNVEAAKQVSVIGGKGCINVEGAQNVAVYDMQGRKVATGAKASLPAGIYVVNADGTSVKVVVK